jgi:hypothetical protein
VRRVGRRVILGPVDDWSTELIGTLGAWNEDIERPRAKPVSKKKDPFE